MPKSRSSRQGLNLSTETLSTPQTISSHNDLTTSPASETFSYSSSANSPVSPLSSPHSPTNTNNKQVGGRLRSIDNSSLGTKQASESSESVSDLLPTAVMSNWAKARSIFFWIVVAPSIGMPILLNNIQLQNPNGLYGYAENWAWAGIFMPLTTFMVAIFPTFIVSTIMGSIKSTAQLIAWRISSVTLASGAAITAYAVVAEVIYPSLTKTHITFPVPWTPIWIPPLATAVASFTARLIR